MLNADAPTTTTRCGSRSRMPTAVVALLIALWGCATAPAPSTRAATQTKAPERPSAVAADTTALPILRVGTSGDYAPFSHEGEGFDVAVAERMARDLGYRVEWVPFAWPDLSAAVAGDAFDVGMSGITFRPDRSLVGSMSRAVALGGPCVLSVDNARSDRVAVNRGGILERWARERHDAAKLLIVDDNRSLPELLARGEVGAVVTDSFEVAHFARDGWRRVCEPARDRKVYWVAPARAATLAAPIDAWLAAHEGELATLRSRWLGSDSRWTATDHLIDLLARRLSLMPAVAAHKRAQGLPIEDGARESVVLEQTLAAADARGLERESVRALFALQIVLAKRVQVRANEAAAPTGPAPDLDRVLRPALSQLGERIVDALAAAAAELPSLTVGQLDLLVPFIDDNERAALQSALRAVRLRD